MVALHFTIADETWISFHHLTSESIRNGLLLSVQLCDSYKRMAGFMCMGPPILLLLLLYLCVERGTARIETSWLFHTNSIVNQSQFVTHKWLITVVSNSVVQHITNLWKGRSALVPSQAWCSCCPCVEREMARARTSAHPLSLSTHAATSRAGLLANDSPRTWAWRVWWKH